VGLGSAEWKSGAVGQGLARGEKPPLADERGSLRIQGTRWDKRGHGPGAAAFPTSCLFIPGVGIYAQTRACVSARQK